MRAADFKKLLNAVPFEPIDVALSDGRSVLIRHPDQVVVAERHLLVGLANIERSQPLATPRAGESIARDWMIVNLLLIAAVAPANGNSRRRGRKSS
jgi:hypothetical protein